MATKKTAVSAPHIRFSYPAPSDLEHVPTVDELVKQGLARAHPHGGFTIEPAGQQLMLDAMKRNGDKGRAFEEQRHAAAAERVRRAAQSAASWAESAFAE